MPGVNDLTQQFIADTYKSLMQKPDINKEEYYNGLGTTIQVINRDALGTVKMFYPPSGTLADYFDTTTGVGIDDWIGWRLCDGRGGTPDLRGRFIAGYTYNYNGDTSLNGQKTKSAFNSVGKVGASNLEGSPIADPTIKKFNLPPHRHKYFDGYMQASDGGPVFSQTLEAYGNSQGVQQSNAIGSGLEITEGVGTDREAAYSIRNTGDGSDNINNQDELQFAPDDFNPAYATLVYCIRVS